MRGLHQSKKIKTLLSTNLRNQDPLGIAWAKPKTNFAPKYQTDFVDVQRTREPKGMNS
jgi:hypothetical protein